MATLFILDWTKTQKSEKYKNYAEMSIERWAERQGGAAFVSVGCGFMFTDLGYVHKEINLFKHILNCNGISYRVVANIDLKEMGESLWLQALNPKSYLKNP